MKRRAGMTQLELSDGALDQLVSGLWPESTVQSREVIGDWQLSRVERVKLDKGSSVILKRARWLMADEGRILASLQNADIPVPRLHLAHLEDGVLTMLLGDLGPSERYAHLGEAASVAVRVHAARPPDGVPVLDEAALRGLPMRIGDGIDRLAAEGRWQRVGRMRGLLERVSALAPQLSEGAKPPPFGLWHSEFHPTSLHIGTAGTALVNWQKAYVGPGLLDLVSWFQMGKTPPLPSDCRALIDAYIAAGGPAEASTRARFPPRRDVGAVLEPALGGRMVRPVLHELDDGCHPGLGMDGDHRTPPG